MDQGLDGSVDVWLEVWVVFARILAIVSTHHAKGWALDRTPAASFARIAVCFSSSRSEKTFS
jgi:hypothetical protein